MEDSLESQLAKQTAMVELFQERFNTEQQNALNAEFRAKLLQSQVTKLAAELEALRNPLTEVETPDEGAKK